MMLDRLTWLIGSPITAVRAGEQSHGGPKSDDTGLAWLDFANGTHATLTTPATLKKGRSEMRSRLLAPRRVCVSQPATTVSG